MEHFKSFKSQNSNEWISSLLSYFMIIKSIDDNIENLRLELCNQNGFDPKLLFEYLDIDNKGFLLTNDFARFLNEMQIPFEERNLRKFIHNFDKDSDFSINLEEFLGLITPKKNVDLNERVVSNGNNFESDIISKNIKYTFGKLLCEELELVNNCIKTAKFCRRTIGFTCYEGFVEIAGNEKYITEKNLYNFLSKNNIMISSNDMHQLMFRLDADNDGNISFDEFKEIFLPIKEDGIIYRNNEFEKENNNSKYNTISTFSDKKSTIDISKNSNQMKNSDFNKLGQNQNVKIENTNNKNLNIPIKEDNLEKKYSNTLSDNDKNFNNSPIAYDISLKKEYNYNYPNNEENIQNYIKTDGIFNKFSTQINDSKLYQETYTNLNEINNTLSSNLNKETTYKNYINDSPLRKNDLESNIPSYKPPKLRNEKLELNYDFSAFSDQDGNEYFRQKKNSKTEINRNYRVIKDDNIENKNYIFNNGINNNYIENKYLDFESKNKTKSCCGCPLFDSLCPCPNSVKYIGNCTCPKRVKNNLNYNSNSSYQRNYIEEVKNNNSDYKKSLKIKIMKSKSQLNFFYNNNKETDINERKFDEKRLQGLKIII